MRSRESISVREGPCNSALPDLQTDLWHVRLNGIAYNHEAPRRGENFVTRKITMAAARIKAGAQLGLEVGDLGSRRDWGYKGIRRRYQRRDAGFLIRNDASRCQV